nr:MAG TPA: hypothetical protein [Crassvirales sp.]
MCDIRRGLCLCCLLWQAAGCCFRRTHTSSMCF